MDNSNILDRNTRILVCLFAEGGLASCMSDRYGSSQNEMEDDSMSFTVDDAVERFGFGKYQKRVYLLCGYHWLALGMQMLLLPLIKSQSQCEFGLSDAQAASISSAVGVGFLTGNFFWGIIADKYGRYPALLLSTFATLVFGLGSAFSQNYISLLVLRGLSTFGVGGNHVSFSLSMEFLPKSARGWAGMIFAGFWSFGVCVLYALAISVMPNLGWRAIIIVGSVPSLFLLLLGNHIPESPMWLAAVSREDMADIILQEASMINNTPLPVGRLVSKKEGVLQEEQNTESESAGFSAFSRPRILSLCIKLWGAWFVCAFSYYGSVVLQPEILAQENRGARCSYAAEDCKQLESHGNCITNKYCSWIDEDHSCVLLGLFDKEPNRNGTNVDTETKTDAELACSSALTTNDYLSGLVSSTGELSGLFVALFTVDKIGRRAILAYMFTLSGTSFFLLSPCSSRRIETWLFFVIRGAAGAYFQGTFIITTEIFPSEIRSTAMGLSAAIARVGLIITPYIGQVLSNIDLDLSIVVYGSACVAAAVASVMVPIETTHRAMTTKVEELDSLLAGNENDAEEFESFKNAEDISMFWRLLRIPAQFDRTVRKDMDMLY